MSGDEEDEVDSTSTQPTTHSHHWVPIRVGRKNGEPINEMRCQECNVKYEPAKEAEYE